MRGQQLVNPGQHVPTFRSCTYINGCHVFLGAFDCACVTTKSMCKYQMMPLSEAGLCHSRVTRSSP
jgi:hypothetical protein